MENYGFAGEEPKSPETELSKIGRALYRALNKYYDIPELSKGMVINGVPQKVYITIGYHGTDAEIRNTLSHVHDDVRSIIASYEIHTEQYIISEHVEESWDEIKVVVTLEEKTT